MSVIYIIMLAPYMVLFFLSRNEQIISDQPSVLIEKFFVRSAEYLIRRSEPVLRKSLFFGADSYFAQHDNSKRKQLSLLNPAIPVERQMHDIRVGKTCKVLMTMFFGILLSLAVSISQTEGGIIEEGNSIARNGYGEGSRDVELLASIESTQESVDFTISEREYTEKELDRLFEKLSDEFPDKVRGENTNKENVTYDLDLMHRIDGFPFTITWESSDYSVIDSDGKVSNDDRDTDETVTLTAICTYGKRQRITSFAVHVLPRVLTAREDSIRRLNEALVNADEKDRSGQYMDLPSKAGMSKVTWSEKSADNSGAVMVLVLICSFFMMIRPEVTLNGDMKKRREQLLEKYPELVSKVTLYMGAGMSLRNIFFRMAEKAEEGNAIRDGTLCKTKGKDYLTDEITLTCNELKSGVQEIKAYENFAKRCGIRQYTRFGTLITQNLKKGSNDLLRVLKSESDMSLEERKNTAKEAGEQASTKLLFPMMLMLVVVMVIIIVPAFMSFSS